MLAACTSVVPSPTPTSPPTADPTDTPTPTAVPESTLTICAGSEPAGLYLHTWSSYIKDLLLQVVYDGPIDPVNFTYQPVILEKVPSLADGDAVVNHVQVKAGDRVMDAEGNVVALEAGTRLRPSGCESSGCEVTFDSSPIEMDQIQVTFKMKPGILWSDGQPVTARDSVYSFTLARDPDTAQYASYTPYLEDRTASYAATDDLTIVWTGVPGFRDEEYFLRFWTPLPQHAWSGYTPRELPELEEVIRTPLGYGPYVIDDWVPGSRIEAHRNENYFRAAEGLPYFDHLVFRFVEGKDALDQLEGGQCDVLTLDTYLENQLERVRELEDEGKLRLYSVAGLVWEHLTFGINSAPDYQRPGFFEDVRVRRAIAYCIDRQRLVDEAINGDGVVAESYVHPDHPLYAGDVIRHYPFGPTQGQALLDQVGWRDEDGDGVREAHGVAGIEDGTPLQFRYETRTNPLREKVLPRIAADLAACGIHAEVGFFDSSFFADGPQGLLFGRRFDLAEFAWLTSATFPCQIYLSSEIPSAENNWDGDNASGYANGSFDAACSQAMKTWPGTETYIAAQREAQRIFSEDLPALPLFSRLNFAAARPDLVGLQLDPVEMAETWNIEAFRLEP